MNKAKTQEDNALMIAAAALLNAEVAAMEAANKFRETCGDQIAYSEEAFLQAIDRYPILQAATKQKGNFSK